MSGQWYMDVDSGQKVQIVGTCGLLLLWAEFDGVRGLIRRTTLDEGYVRCKEKP